MIEIKITAEFAAEALNELKNLAQGLNGVATTAAETKLKVAKADPESDDDEEETPPAKKTRTRTSSKKTETKKTPEPEDDDDEDEFEAKSSKTAKITDKMLIDLGAEKVDEDADNMPLIKKLMADFGVKKLSEVDEDDRPAFLKKLQKL